MITSAVWLSWWYKLNLSKGRINSSSKLFLFHYFSVIKVAFYFQFNTNMITSSPSSLNSLLHISLVLYKSHIVWCHCWCIIEQHFVCCSGDWRYRFIRKVRPCRLYFWKAFHDSLQVFWWNLSYMSISTQQRQPWKRSIFTGQFEIDFHRWLCTCPKIEPTHEWAREFQENTKITWDLITRASFRIPSYMIAIAQLAAMKFARKFAFFWNAFFLNICFWKFSLNIRYEYLMISLSVQRNFPQIFLFIWNDLLFSIAVIDSYRYERWNRRICVCVFISKLKFGGKACLRAFIVLLSQKWTNFSASVPSALTKAAGYGCIFFIQFIRFANFDVSQHYFKNSNNCLCRHVCTGGDEILFLSLRLDHVLDTFFLSLETCKFE